jgi:hypothetical protein
MVIEMFFIPKMEMNAPNPQRQQIKPIVSDAEDVHNQHNQEQKSDCRSWMIQRFVD